MVVRPALQYIEKIVIFPAISYPEVRACKQTFWYNWDSMVHVHRNGEVFVKTGDIPDMWTRDSAAQMYPYVQLLKRSSPPKKPTASSGNVSNGVIIGVLEGFIKTSARLLISDPYANSYSEDVKPLQTTKESFKLNRGGSVATGNFELDSGPHFLRLVAAYNRAVPGSKVMEDEALRVAIRTLLTLYRTEQYHITVAPTLKSSADMIKTSHFEELLDYFSSKHFRTYQPTYAGFLQTFLLESFKVR